MPRLVSFRGLIQNYFLRGIPAPFKLESAPQGLYTNLHCLHLEQLFETLLEEMKLDTKCP